MKLFKKSFLWLFLLSFTVLNAGHGDLQSGYASYKLVKNPSSLFAVDAKSGVVTLAKSLENSDAKSFTLEILATSKDGSTVNQEFVVNVVEKSGASVAVDMSINKISDANTHENIILKSATVGAKVGIVAVAEKAYEAQSIGDMLSKFAQSTGIAAFLNPDPNEVNGHGEPMSTFHKSAGRIIMILITFLLFYLAIKKGYEPLLLIPIAFGGLLANIPIANIAGEGGFLGVIYNMGIANELFPILIFMGVGAMTDFGPLLSNPRTAMLGGAAQFGIFATLVGAAALSQYTELFDFTLKQASAISIIGGADGPTSIYIASTLAPELLGAIAVASYSYMALVPIIQPPIMKALTTASERKIKMVTSRHVSRMEKLLFPIMVLSLSILILPDSTPLIGAFMFGNFVKESGVVERLNDTLQNGLINIVTIFLGLGVGSKLAADQFLVSETLAILVLGLIAFSIGTAAGVLMAKLMNKFSKNKINPLIGSAGVSAVPMAARVSNKVGMESDRSNMLLMHAMGPNVAGVIGSAVAAGVMISFFS